MKYLLMALMSAMILSCSAKVEVRVENSLDLERTNETVELAWGDVASKLKGVTPQSVVVTDNSGKQVASQVIYNGGEAPLSLIFQVSVAAKGSASYTIVTGTREEYPSQAFGRFVPERMDDYAWENNVVAFRLYGPALKDPVVPGIDVWSKCTERLIIDEWYAKGKYHDNEGDGMDCYKVGPTLGCGASTPFLDGKLVMAGKYVTQKNLANGPIRTTVELTYGPFAVGNDTVTMTKVISLDANTHFSKMVDTYHGAFGKISVAAGMVMHDVQNKFIKCDQVGLSEWASDSKQPQQDGLISAAVIMIDGQGQELDGHLVMVTDVKPEAPMTYWAGAAWSGAKVKDAAAWESVVAQTTEQIEEPLKVAIAVK